MCDSNQIDVGYVGKKLLKEAAGKGVSQKQIFNVRMESRDFIQKTVINIQEKSPLKYQLCRVVSCLDPRNLLKSEDSMLAYFQCLLRELETSEWILESDCDKIIGEYRQLRENMRSSEVEKATCESFKPGKDRVDTFYADKCKKSFPHLWQVLTLILPMSHGQATVERGFSFNKEVTVTNISEEGLIAKRQVVDHIHSVLGIHKVDINAKMMSYVSASRMKYQTYLEEKKMKEANKTKKRERDDLMNEIDQLRHKKMRLETEEKDLKHQS